MRVCSVWPVALALLSQSVTSASAQPAAGLEPKRAELPITRIVLYSSGVGYYLREGDVTGSARIDLQFPEPAVNDLLKSLVVSDRAGRVACDGCQLPTDCCLCEPETAGVGSQQAPPDR